jgi:hypothetical protein
MPVQPRARLNSGAASPHARFERFFHARLDQDFRTFQHHVASFRSDRSGDYASPGGGLCADEVSLPAPHPEPS